MSINKGLAIDDCDELTLVTISNPYISKILLIASVENCCVEFIQNKIKQSLKKV